MGAAVVAHRECFCVPCQRRPGSERPGRPCRSALPATSVCSYGPAMGVMRVRAVLLSAALLAGGAAVSPAAADNVITPTPKHRNLEVHLQPYVTLPDATSGAAPRINAMATAGGRTFVIEELDARIYEIVQTQNGPQAELFFDVEAAVANATGRGIDHTNTFHGGLRSVAFHPDFESNGLFYTSAMEQRPNNGGAHRYLSDVADPIVADSVLIEWRANLATGQPISTSYREVFRVGMPVYDHPIKQITFNPYARSNDPDYGLLYIAHGDGSVKSAEVGGGQNNDALGKILRIDPTQNGNAPFSVPSSNPFVGQAGMLDEVYSLGHRNPHHLSFGMVGGEAVLFAAEPGRDNVEEINIIEPGRDYGWPQREGTFVHLAEGGIATGVAPLPANDATFGFTYPATQVGHEGPTGSTFVKQAIAGGFPVLNGSPLSGQYLFSDFAESGTLYHSGLVQLTTAITSGAPNALSQAPVGVVKIKFDHDGDPSTTALDRVNLVDVFNDSPLYETTRADVRFGQGPGGELYITSKRNNTIYLVTSSLPGGPGGFSGTRSTFVCSVTATGGGFDVTWENPPANATRMVIERQASSRYWWRGRVDTSAKAFTDSGRLPPRTSRIDYRVTAKNNAGSVLEETDCLLRTTPGHTCTITRTAGNDVVTWEEHRSGDLVVTRQRSADRPFYWRGRVDSSVTTFVDAATSGPVAYQVIGRDNAGYVVDGAACSVHQ